MNINEVEKKLKISRANIRFYEKEGLLEPKRNDNGYRLYTDNDVKRLEQILLFRKCNVSIENIRLIFNGSKQINEVFQNQISIIENEINELDGAKLMCEKLAQEENLIENFDTKKYINIMDKEESKGNKFYNVAQDYILATEKLYQSIIENKNFKGGKKMKKSLKVGLYFLQALLLFGCSLLFDLIFKRPLDFTEAIIFSLIFTMIDVVGVKKYIESKTGEKYTKKEYLKVSFTILLVLIIALFAISLFENIYVSNKNPNENILNLSIQKDLIEIAEKKYNENEGIYAEGHKIIDYEIKNNEIYVYVNAIYGTYDKDTCNAINNTKNVLTMIYNKSKNSEGIYELKKYNENDIPNNLKDKSNVNYDDSYFKNQLNNYCK